MSLKLYTLDSSGNQIAFIDLLLGAARILLHRVKVIAVLVIGHAVPNNGRQYEKCRN